MKNIIAVVVLFCAGLLHANDWKPDEALLLAIREVESNGGKYLYGDNGRSLGEYQMTRAAWNDVNKWRKARKSKAYDYRTYVFTPAIAKDYASNYLSILRSGLQGKLRRAPSASELYAAYNMGFSKFGACGFNLGRINSTTARKCREIEGMLNQRMVASAEPL